MSDVRGSPHWREHLTHGLNGTRKSDYAPRILTNCTDTGHNGRTVEQSVTREFKQASHQLGLYLAAHMTDRPAHVKPQPLSCGVSPEAGMPDD